VLVSGTRLNALTLHFPIHTLPLPLPWKIMHKFFIPPRRRRWGRIFTWLLTSLCALVAVAVAGSPVAVSWAMWVGTSSNTGDSWSIGSFCTAPAALPATGDAHGGTRVALTLPATAPLAFSAVDGGNSHSLALASEGTVWAWGYNLYGQLGDGTTTESHVPVQVKGLEGKTIAAIAAGGNRSTVLASDGTVWDWGYGKQGQLGNGVAADSGTPVQGLEGKTIAALADGFDHTLALASRGAVWAWGYNLYGQLGEGTTVNSLAPVQVKAADRTVGKATGVAVGGSAAADIVMADCPELTVIFTTPAHAAGATDITVTTQTKSGAPGPTLTYSGGFAYTT